MRNCLTASKCPQVAGHKSHPVLDGSGGDQGVGRADADLAADPAGPFGHRPVHRQFPERAEQFLNPLGFDRAREQLASRDDGVVEAVPSGPQLPESAQMIDEDVWNRRGSWPRINRRA